MNSVIHTHLTRRKLLALGIAAGTTPELLIKLNGSMGQSGHLSESVLIEASELSGEILSRERVHAAKVLVEFCMKHLATLREFDPDEEEPFGKFCP
jgi:hypothetical protein